MDDKRNIKKILGVLIHLSELRGRNFDLFKRKRGDYYQKKSEELKNILIDNWSNISTLMKTFRKFQKSLNNDREKSLL